jgi:hypothetical protein
MTRICLPERAFNDRRIRGTHLRLLAAIAALGEGVLSLRQMSGQSGISDRDLRRQLRELEDFGYLVTIPNPGSESSYSINFNDIDGGEENSPQGEKKHTPTVPPLHVPLSSPSGLPLLSPLNPPSLSPQKRARATRLADDWRPSAASIVYAESKGFSGDDLDRQIEDFRDYWQPKSGQNATKLDWSKTWATWIRKAADWRGRQQINGHIAKAPNGLMSYDEPWPQRVRSWKRDGVWMFDQWGPRPGERGCRAPPELVA